MALQLQQVESVSEIRWVTLLHTAVLREDQQSLAKVLMVARFIFSTQLRHVELASLCPRVGNGETTRAYVTDSG